MKILIIKASSLGDIIHAYPVLAYIKSKYPHAQVDWIVEEPFADLVKAHPYVSKAIPVETKKWRKAPLGSWKEISHFCKDLQSIRYDVAFDLQGNIKSGLILSRAEASDKVGFGWKTAPERPNCFFTHIKYDPPQALSIREENLFFVQSYFGDKTPFIDMPIQLKLSLDDKQKLEHILTNLQQPTTLVCLGSAWPNKQASPEALTAFLKKLISPLAFAWGSEKELKEVKDIAQHFPNSTILEKLSLPLLQNLMTHMNLVVAMDSLPLHLAGTTSTRIYGIFGPSSAAKYMPQGPNNHSCQGVCPYGRTFDRRCPILRTCPTGACIKALTGDQIFKKFKS